MHYEYPEGWFAVAIASEINLGRVVKTQAFGREFVVFRTNMGTIGVLDGRCPNCGMDLSYKSRVIDEYLQCPFHGTLYGVDGTLSTNATNPNLQRARAWQAKEIHGLVFIWYSEYSSKPSWEFVVPTEPLDSSWTVTPWSRKEDIHSTLEVVRQDSADWQHYPFVHGAQDAKVSVQTDSYKLFSQVHFSLENPKWLGPLHRLQGHTDHTFHGLGYFTSFGKLWLETNNYMLLNYYIGEAVTPIDETNLRMYMRIGIPRRSNSLSTFLTEQLTKLAIANGLKQERTYWQKRQFTDTEFKGDELLTQYDQWLKRFRPTQKINTRASYQERLTVD